MIQMPKKAMAVLLVFLMLLSMYPFSVSASEVEDIPSTEDSYQKYLPEPIEYSDDGGMSFFAEYNYDDIPAEMKDNPVLRALEYTGYGVQYLKDKKHLYEPGYFGSALARDFPNLLSGITYSSVGNGQQTVEDSTTYTGLAPDIEYFRSGSRSGLDCVDFVTYYFVNYLPNIEGVDTSVITEHPEMMDNYEEYHGFFDDMYFWYNAFCDDNKTDNVAWNEANGVETIAKLRVYEGKNDTDAYYEALAKAQIGDLIRMGRADSGRECIVHYALYAGYYNGRHYLIHVANNNGPEISTIGGMSSAGEKSSWVLGIYRFHFPSQNDSGFLEIQKVSETGVPLDGAYFVAVNDDTAEAFEIGPTVNGYARSGELPFGNYTVRETVFPEGYRADEISQWQVSLTADTPDHKITIHAVNHEIVGDLKIQKTTNTGENLSGWEFGIYLDMACTQAIVGSPFTSGADGTITVADLKPGVYYVKEIPINDPYWVCDTTVQAVVVEQDTTTTVTFSNTHYGNLRIKKIAVNGSSEGWSFQILDVNKNVLEIIKTDADGYATSGMLLPGKYYVREIQDQDGTFWEYDANVERQVTITAGSQTQEEYTNVYHGLIEFRKTTNTGNHLAGWTFRVTDSNGNVVGDYTTDENGYAVTGKLVPGSYTVQELATGDDYWQVDITPHGVVVEAGKITVDSWHNTELGLGRIRKQTNTGENLAGWKFHIYTDEACTQPVEGSPFVTAQDGTITEKLLPGTYYVKEVVGSDQDPYWEYDSSVRELVVTAGAASEYVTFTNVHRGMGKIIKSMPDGGSPAGWEFEIYRLGEDVPLGIFTTGEDGTFLTAYLLPGDYIVRELIPEDSPYFCTSENPQTVTIRAGEITEVFFTNSMKSGQISIQKVDPEGNHLSGAEFLLEWSVDGSTWNPVTYSDSGNGTAGVCTSVGLAEGRLTTGESGLVTFTGLHPGVLYRITETAAPSGYQLHPGPVYEGKLGEELLVELTVVNDPSFELPMTGSNTGLLLTVLQLVCPGTSAALILCCPKKQRQ